MLAFKRGGRGVVPVLPPMPVTIPDPPEDLGDYGVMRWNAFWTTPVSGVVDLSRDGERLRHWAVCVQARYELEGVLGDHPLMDAGLGRMVAHPLWVVWGKLNGEIERAEQHFGMTPLAKMRLTGALDQAEAAEVSIKARREGRRPTVVK